MPANTSPAAPRAHWVVYAIALTLTLALYILYAANMAWWSTSPDFGWRTTYNSGPNVVAQVFERGHAAGLRPGDVIVAVNGRAYTTFDELFFGGIRADQPGSVNTYSIDRRGEKATIPVTTGRLGLPAVLWRSGQIFAIGLIFVAIGALVFLMKPRARESWLFLLMTCLIGLRVSYAAPADLLRPTWLYDVRFFFELASSAAVIHLALTFPRTPRPIRRRPWVLIVPYLASLMTLVLWNVTGTAYWNMPRGLFLVSIVLSILAALVFLVSMAWNVLKDPSVVIRLQSRVMFVGIVLGLLVPATDLVVRSLSHVYLFPDPTVGSALFLSLFPLSIGYTIVKHDLFAVDTIVRRTYGYVLSTGSVVAAYVVFVSTLNVAFQSTEVSGSPLFSIAFALGVVLAFEPLHRRFQSLVDRVFYRQRYDYRKTIKSISEAMTSLFDADVIRGRLIDSVAREMFLENAVALVPRPQGNGYGPGAAAGASPAHVSGLAGDHPLLALLKSRRDPVARHEIELNPAYEQDRDALLAGFRALAAELLVPMAYKDELTGIMSLGPKKSGKLFTPEDLDLLRTLANQSAVALENAKLFQEHLEKGRLEEELKIAREIQASMLPERAPKLPGLAIAARSIPARQVGGDLYDFIEVPGAGGPDLLAIFVGDVSGKAMSGALMMSAARSTYRLLVATHPGVSGVMHLANQRLHADLKRGMFVALLYALFDPGARTLTLVNAGQTQPILCPGDGSSKPIYIETEGDTFPLGIVPDCVYKEMTLALSPGDAVVFYTDGVVEAMNARGELYGFERLTASIEAGRGLDAQRLLDKILDDVNRHAGDVEPHDDLTIVVARAA